VHSGYSEDEAACNGHLHRYHGWQQQRNLDHRGYGLDERILRMDRRSAQAFSVGAPYAEFSELELFWRTAPFRELGVGREGQCAASWKRGPQLQAGLRLWGGQS
jgi:hypothetical protein